MYEQMKFLESQGRQTEIDSGAFRKIIRETKELGTKSILFIGGEPLLRRDLFDLISYAKEFGLSTVVVTNGVLLNGNNLEKCFEAGVNWLSISIDAASEGVFSKIRGENVLGKIIKNVETLNDLRRRKKEEFPKVVVVCTIMDDNLKELLEVIHLCKRLEVERVLFQPVVANNIDQTERKANSSGFVPPERFDLLDEAMDELINYKKGSLQNFNFIGNSIRNLKLIKKYFRGSIKPFQYQCYAGYNRAQIVQEGKLYFCVSQEKYKANFGDINKDSLRDLWFSKEAKFYRKLIKRCKSPCLQWCSYRDDFNELIGIFQKKFLFGFD
jgi:radical SAM protein with 4Fe4S-binding SPASM domain